MSKYVKPYEPKREDNLVTPDEYRDWLRQQANKHADDPQVMVVKGERLTFTGRRRGSLEKCQYCESCYHPMMRYTNDAGELIFVCSIKFAEDGKTTKQDDCINKALADGYRARPDLTPKR